MSSSQTCRVCGESKALSEFTYRQDSQKYRSECKPCRSFYSAAKRYNVTIEYVQELRKAQGGCCAICGTHENEITHESFIHSPLVIDHDHVSGDVRGLLCPTCNSLLGHAKDNPQTLLNAVSYLVKHQS